MLDLLCKNKLAILLFQQVPLLIHSQEVIKQHQIHNLIHSLIPPLVVLDQLYGRMLLIGREVEQMCHSSRHNLNSRRHHNSSSSRQKNSVTCYKCYNSLEDQNLVILQCLILQVIKIMILGLNVCVCAIVEPRKCLPESFRIQFQSHFY